MIDRPIGFRLLVEPQQAVEKTASGILTGTAEMLEQQQRGMDVGTVLGIGPSAFKLERFGDVPVKVGDKIRFKQYAGHIFRHKDATGKPTSGFYQIINDDDVLSIIEESENV